MTLSVLLSVRKRNDQSLYEPNTMDAAQFVLTGLITSYLIVHEISIRLKLKPLGPTRYGVAFTSVAPEV